MTLDMIAMVENRSINNLVDQIPNDFYCFWNANDTQWKYQFPLRATLQFDEAKY